MVQGTPRLLIEGVVFGEGPRWHDGRLWFSDMHAYHVDTVDMDGRRETIVTVPEKPSGLGWLPDGRLLVVSMNDRRLLRLENGTLVEHADLSALAPATCNDMVVDGQGRAYVGNFGFDMFAGAEARTATLVRVDPDGTATIAADDLAFPNGTVITPDGRTLIVGESRGRRLTAFEIAADGSLSNRRVWADIGQVPDGCAMDAEGCVWVAVPRDPGKFIRVAEGGAILDEVDAGGLMGIACALGGPDGRTLFLLESRTTDPAKITGPDNGRIRMVEVEVPRAGWP